MLKTAQVDYVTVPQVYTADGNPKKVLFILSTQGGRIMAAGRNSAADGHKPMTDEAPSAHPAPFDRRVQAPRLAFALMLLLLSVSVLSLAWGSIRHLAVGRAG